MSHSRQPPSTAVIRSTAAVVAMVGVHFATPRVTGAQSFFGLGGIEGRVGLAAPEAAQPGLAYAIDLDLGYVRVPRLRAVLGLNGFRADVDRRVSGRTVGGSFTATGGRAGLRYEPFGPGRLTPYAVGTVVGIDVDADTEEPGVDRLLDGFYIGAGAGAGMSYALDELERYSVVAEARRVFVTNVSHWAFEFGVRVMPRGRGTYTRSATR